MIRQFIFSIPVLLLVACDDHAAHEGHEGHEGHDKHASTDHGKADPHAGHAKTDAHAGHAKADPHAGHSKPAAAGTANTQGTAEAAKALHIMDARVRAMPPGSPNTGAFLSFHNPTEQHAALLSASSPAAKTVELHTHVQEDGQFKMRQIDRIDVAPDQMVKLAPGGLHIMLIGLTGDLTEGDEVALTLSFEGGHTTELKVPVKKIDASAGGHGDHAGHAGQGDHAGH